ncbi:MAG: methyltransferase type 12 [Verrucomicrobia bacterium]|nr:MAG: methyltransferase type 12 [Verrucomicrobiota bacterium]
MIIHKLLYRYFKYHDDEVFYLMQAQDSVRWLDQVGVALKPGVEVLDLGCGHGIFGGEFIKKGCTVTFADDSSYIRPEFQSSRFLTINLDQDDYSKLGQYDLVILSNVFEHLARPERFLDELPKLLKPNGRLYLSWTNWFSPFGGHDFAPLHYLGPRFGRWLHFKLKGKWSDHVPYAGLYITHIGRTLRMIRARPNLKIYRRATRYYTELSFLLAFPIIREFLAWNCVLLIGKKKPA